MKTTVHLALVSSLLLVSAPRPRAAAQDGAAPHPTTRLTVADASVSVLCPMTIGGSFEAKTSHLSGELALRSDQSGRVEGALAVDLRTLRTGIGLRDDHLRTKYLQVQRGPRYAEATLTRIRLDHGDLTSPKSTALFRGILSLHGQDQEVEGTADIRHSGDALRVHATFPVRPSQFQIPSPSYLGVGVRDEVIVEVALRIAPASPEVQ